MELKSINIKEISIKKLALLFFTLGILLIYIFVAKSANFHQNDDWVYRLNVQYFLEGNFALHPYLGPTFITQAYLGYFWSKLFGIQNLNVLTALLSFISVCTFFYYLLSIDRKSVTATSRYMLLTAISVVLYMFNPYQVYSSIGFMTEQYFMVFLIPMLYFIHKYIESYKVKYLIFTFVLSLIAFHSRQVTLIIPLSLFLWFSYDSVVKILQYLKQYSLGELLSLFRTNPKNEISKNSFLSLLSLLWFLTFYLYFENYFPKTPRMIEVPLQLHHLSSFDYFYSLIYGVLIILCAFLAPLFIYTIYESYKNDILDKSYIKFVLGAALWVGLYFTLQHYFKPNSISWGEFPYFENTVERTGYYPRGIHGTKSGFLFNYDLYLLWDLFSKTLVSGFLSVLLLNIRKFIKYELFIIVTYLLVLVVTETFYDRYILPLIPMTIIYLYKLYLENESSSGATFLKSVENIFKPLIGITFSLFLVFLAYLFSTDFILTNNYVWNSSNMLVQSGVTPNKIHSTNPWKLTYRNYDKSYEYMYSYDSPKVNSDLNSLYDLVETHEVDFPLNIFTDSRLYLYKLKNTL